MSLPLSYLDLPDIDDVEAIRISSEGEVNNFNLPKISVIEILLTDAVFHPQPWQISKISQLIGLPIAGRKLIAEHDLPDSVNTSNGEATLLFQNIDIHAPDYRDEMTGPFEGFGWAPEYWQFSVGPVVIARLDKKPLHPLHASAFIKFCSGHICTKVQEMGEMLADEESFPSWRKLTALEKKQRVMDKREAIIDECTKEKFEEYFRIYKSKRVHGVRMSRFDLSFEAWDVPEWEKAARPEWTGVPSPYDV